MLNRVELSGILLERKALRYTPAGVPASEFLIQHVSEQEEAGSQRRVECEISAIALGDPARWVEAAATGTAVRLTGFMAAKSRNSRQLVMHVNKIEFLEGN